MLMAEAYRATCAVGLMRWNYWVASDRMDITHLHLHQTTSLSMLEWRESQREQDSPNDNQECMCSFDTSKSITVDLNGGITSIRHRRLDTSGFDSKEVNRMIRNDDLITALELSYLQPVWLSTVDTWMQHRFSSDTFTITFCAGSTA